MTAGKSLERSIAQGCATKLDGPDDSDDSATDFSERTPSPRNNTVTPTETNCPVPPATTLSATGRPTNPTNQTSATFNFTATGNFTGFECKLDTDAGFAACTNPKTYTAGQIAEGSRTFQVRAVGPGGPDATPAFYTWRVDTTPPDTEITDPKPASPNGGVQATLTFQALGSLAVGETQPTFACRLITPSTPSPTFSSCTSPSTQQTPASGTYTFEVRSTDQAGNPDPSPASHTWEVDLSNPDPPPETTITKAAEAEGHRTRPEDRLHVDRTARHASSAGSTTSPSRHAPPRHPTKQARSSESTPSRSSPPAPAAPSPGRKASFKIVKRR